MVLEVLKQIKMRGLVFVGLLVLGSAGVAISQTDFSEEVAQIHQQSLEQQLEDPVIFIGSSSIKMWSSLEQDFPDVPVLNHGFGGSTYSDILKFKDVLVEEFEPAVVVVYSGDNDIADQETPQKIASRADQFVDGLQREAPGALVIVLAAKPSIARWSLKDKYLELNTLLNEMTSNYEHAVFVDVWGPMLNAKGEVNSGLFAEDGLHMNKEGYTIWKNLLLPYLSK